MSMLSTDLSRCCLRCLITDMELGQLRIFVAAAESSSFTAAAKKLYVSHSTISRGIAALEEELGVALFERDNRVFGLTEAGEKLLPLAKEMLQKEEEIRAIL